MTQEILFTNLWEYFVDFRLNNVKLDDISYEKSIQ